MIRIAPLDFFLADTPSPILSADFLHHYNFLVDVSRRRLINTTTSLSVSGTAALDIPVSSVLFQPTGESPYDLILKDFPQLTYSPTTSAPVRHDITHCIVAMGSLVAPRPRRLAPDHIAIVKNEFNHMLEFGIILPSGSNGSSPLHVVTKKAPGDW